MRCCYKPYEPCKLGPHLSRIDTRYGQLELPENGDDLVGQFLSRYGEWAWDEVTFVASNLAPGARVLDVGAFLGTFGLGLSLCQHLASVCYVEANPNVTPLLKENIRRLKRQPSQVVAAMVYGKDEPPALGHIDRNNWGALSFASAASGELFTQEAESSVTLAELRELYGPFDLIKLDVEGMERELIESDAEFLRSGHCKIWLECNEDAASLELFDVLQGLELEIYYFAFPSYNPDNYRRDPEAIYPLAFEAGLLAGRHLSPALDDRLRAHGCLLRQVCSAEELREALWQTPRWGLKEWEAKSASEVSALAGRALTGQDYGRFLKEDGAPTDWLGSLALVDRVRHQEAQLRTYAAALEGNWQGDQAAIRGFVERESTLRDQLQVHNDAQQRLEQELGQQRGALEERESYARALEARLSEVRAAARERAFQLSVLTTRIAEAEAAAVAAQADLFQAVQGKMDETIARENAEQALHLERELAQQQAVALNEQLTAVRNETSVVQAQLDAFERAAIQEAEQKKKPKSLIKQSRFYRKKFRPLVKKIKDLAHGRRSGAA